MFHKIFGDATQKLWLRGFVLMYGNSAQGRQSRTPLEWRAQRCKAITKKNYWAKLVSGGRVVGGRGRGVRGGYLRCWFVVLAGRRHTRAPVVLSWFQIIQCRSIMKRNVLLEHPHTIFSSFHVPLGHSFGTELCLSQDLQAQGTSLLMTNSLHRCFGIKKSSINRSSMVYHFPASFRNTRGPTVSITCCV